MANAHFYSGEAKTTKHDKVGLGQTITPSVFFAYYELYEYSDFLLIQIFPPSNGVNRFVQKIVNVFAALFALFKRVFDSFACTSNSIIYGAVMLVCDP